MYVGLIMLIFMMISNNETWLTCLLMEVMAEIAVNFLTGKNKKKRL